MQFLHLALVEYHETRPAEDEEDIARAEAAEVGAQLGAGGDSMTGKAIVRSKEEQRRLDKQARDVMYNKEEEHTDTAAASTAGQEQEGVSSEVGTAAGNTNNEDEVLFQQQVVAIIEQELRERTAISSTQYQAECAALTDVARDIKLFAVAMAEAVNENAPS